MGVLHPKLYFDKFKPIKGEQYACFLFFDKSTLA